MANPGLKAYPGTRDFYPDDMEFRNWMAEKQRIVCERYGYREYGAPILEYLDLYLRKSSEEIVSEQLYIFTDRGERKVAIRPEMTPTLARMVSGRPQSYLLPLRWFSIANFMRYERPGRGRLREFYQLNVDLLGSESISADVEVLALACDVMKEYGASPSDYVLRFSDRRLLDHSFADLNGDQLRELGRLLDKKDKLNPEDFRKSVDDLGGAWQRKDLLQQVEAFYELSLDSAEGNPILEHLREIRDRLSEHVSKESFRFDPGIVRGFDYYTGLVFEMNDTHPDNARALFGGGRYDRLLSQFGKESIPAVGFGMGDVTLQDFLEVHNLRPDLGRRTSLFLTVFSEDTAGPTEKAASRLRSSGLSVELSLDGKRKLGKQFDLAEKKGHSHVGVMGPEELEKGMIRIKNLSTGSQQDVAVDDLNPTVLDSIQ
ncbi:MAG: histidine--tRNA ligase [Leptospiraceae bacterium]|nr:histidine--tRNA ligase [Leptospiraceae bacterium]